MPRNSTVDRPRFCSRSKAYGLTKMQPCRKMSDGVTWNNLLRMFCDATMLNKGCSVI